MGSCAPAVPRHRRSARWKWSKISAGGDELLERHAPECAAEDSTQAPHNLPRRQARSGAEVGRLEAAAMANGCDEAGGRVSLSEYPGYRLRLGVHLYGRARGGRGRDNQCVVVCHPELTLCHRIWGGGLSGTLTGLTNYLRP